MHTKTTTTDAKRAPIVEFLRGRASITLTAEPDDQPVRGNVIASGNAIADRIVEDAIITRLLTGDVWAWAAVTVRATYLGSEGVDYLGACSYTDADAFREPGGYYTDMVDEALDELAHAILLDADAYAALARATGIGDAPEQTGQPDAEQYEVVSTADLDAANMALAASEPFAQFGRDALRIILERAHGIARPRSSLCDGLARDGFLELARIARERGLHDLTEDGR